MTPPRLPEAPSARFPQITTAVGAGQGLTELSTLAEVALDLLSLGEVIGINSQIYSRSGGYQGVAFAVPIDVAMNIEE